MSICPQNEFKSPIYFEYIFRKRQPYDMTQVEICCITMYKILSGYGYVQQHQNQDTWDCVNLPILPLYQVLYKIHKRALFLAFFGDRLSVLN